MARRAKSGHKYYILKSGRDAAVFTGRHPRQAALKAATRGVTEIKLRERGRRNRDRTYTIHVFKGGRQKVALDNGPSWLPGTVWKPWVKKVRSERVRTIR